MELADFFFIEFADVDCWMIRAFAVTTALLIPCNSTSGSPLTRATVDISSVFLCLLCFLAKSSR